MVIGGGPAGLTAAITAARAGHTVALAERNLTGGTCVNFGCTPSWEGEFDVLCDLIAHAAVVGMDETGWKVGTTGCSLWAFASECQRLFHRSADRRRHQGHRRGTETPEAGHQDSGAGRLPAWQRFRC